ncbi:MAG: ArnT family glycosyltransferase [Tenacibaculum sp.]
MKKNVLFYLFFVLILAKIYYSFFVFPNPDEAYYWLWGQFPALSYHDHPALQALIQNIFSCIFGTSIISLRSPVLISNIVIVYVLSLIFKKLAFSNHYLYVVLFFSSPLFFLFTTFAWNDYLLLSNCILSGFFFLNYFHDIWLGLKGKFKDVLFACLFFGLAILSKYNAVFLGLGILSMIVSNKKFHKIFKDYKFYIGVLIIFLLSLPILVWNSNNSFGSFEFNLKQRTIEPLLNNNLFKGNYLGFIFGSVLILSPFIWWGIFCVFKKTNALKSKTNAYTEVYLKFSKHIFFISTASFLFLSLFSNVLYYWNIIGLLFITPLALYFIIKNNKINYLLVYSSVLITGMLIHFGIIPLTLIFGGNDKDGVYHYGWETVKKHVLKYRQIENKPIVTSSYRSASLLAFALNEPEIFAYSPRFDQFDYWAKNYKYKSKDALILTDDRSPINKELILLFKDIKILDTIVITKYNYTVKTYYLHKGYFK